VRLADPTLAMEAVRLAEPFDTVAVPRVAEPFKKVTVPVAVDGTTALRVKLIPVPTDDADDVSVVVLLALVTVRATPALVLGEYPVGLVVAL
jgi:hypothetical protein